MFCTITTVDLDMQLPSFTVQEPVFRTVYEYIRRHALNEKLYDTHLFRNNTKLKSRVKRGLVMDLPLLSHACTRVSKDHIISTYAFNSAEYRPNVSILHYVNPTVRSFAAYHNSVLEIDIKNAGYSILHGLLLTFGVCNETVKTLATDIEGIRSKVRGVLQCDAETSKQFLLSFFHNDSFHDIRSNDRYFKSIIVGEQDEYFLRQLHGDVGIALGQLMTLMHGGERRMANTNTRTCIHDYIISPYQAKIVKHAVDHMISLQIPIVAAVGDAVFVRSCPLLPDMNTLEKLVADHVGFNTIKFANKAASESPFNPLCDNEPVLRLLAPSCSYSPINPFDIVLPPDIYTDETIDLPQWQNDAGENTHRLAYNESRKLNYCKLLLDDEIGAPVRVQYKVVVEPIYNRKNDAFRYVPTQMGNASVIGETSHLYEIDIRVLQITILRHMCTITNMYVPDDCKDFIIHFEQYLMNVMTKHDMTRRQAKKAVYDRMINVSTPNSLKLHNDSYLDRVIRWTKSAYAVFESTFTINGVAVSMIRRQLSDFGISLENMLVGSFQSMIIYNVCTYLHGRGVSVQALVNDAVFIHHRDVQLFPTLAQDLSTHIAETLGIALTFGVTQRKPTTETDCMRARVRADEDLQVKIAGH